MKVCVIYGSPRKGNTYKAAQIIKERLIKGGDIEFVEFFLPRDMPHFCCGCYNCIEKGEEKCPHSEYTLPIAKAIKDSDGLILTTPVYVLAESAAIKSLMEHLGYMYIPHRPMEEMFSKVAIVVSTTAGAGTRYAIKTVARTLNYWGAKRIYKCGLRIFAKNWEEMKPGKQQKFKRNLERKADKFHRAAVKQDKLHTLLFTRFMFFMMKKMMGNYQDGHTDKEYWRSKGWLNGKSKPF
jgi:multimeric flavodoxin WrbA